MALKPCWQCQRLVSTEAPQCLHCKVPLPARNTQLCRECKNDVPAAATTCPHCGIPMATATATFPLPGRPKTIAYAALGILSAVLVLTMLIIMSRDQDDRRDDPKQLYLRQEFASRLQRAYDAAGFKYRVELLGEDKSALSIQSPEMNEALVNQMIAEQGGPLAARVSGLKWISFSNNTTSWNYNVDERRLDAPHQRK